MRSIFSLASVASLFGLYTLSAATAVGPALQRRTTASGNAKFSIEAVKLVERDDHAAAASSPTTTASSVTTPAASTGTAMDPVPFNQTWHIMVELGTPPQSFLMLPDSGAGSLAISSIFLPKNESGGAPVYDPNKSTTASKLAGYSYKNCYGSGHCGSGVVYRDVVKVGSLSTTMAFEVATGNNGVGNGNPMDSGDFGLAYSKNGMSTQPKAVPTWLQTVLPQLDQPLFTIDYNIQTKTGSFDFGYIDSSKYSGQIGYTPNQSEGFWAVEFTGYAVGASAALTKQGWKSIVDSGTAASSVPRFVVDGFFQNVKGAAYSASHSTYTYPCSTTLPDFVFGVGSSYRGIIPGGFLANGPVGNGLCVSKLVAGSGNTTFGENFIEAQFVVFDYGNDRIGFANKPASVCEDSSFVSCLISEMSLLLNIGKS